MSAYNWIEITEPEDYDQLVQILDPEFDPQSVSAQLQEAITDQVRAVLVEHGYVDKDYRSTFYNFYAKMGRTYRDDCVRLHFFDEYVSFDKEKTDIIYSGDDPEDYYFGYVVLRPTISGTLGRSILWPNIRVGARGQAIQSLHHVHLLGYRFRVRGFPSMAQHADIAVCAHVVCWAILRHYSERFPPHRELLVHDVTRLATPFDPGGLTPSFGLNILQAERIFQAAGCFPVVVLKEANADSEFYSKLLAYLESGFPLFVAMEGHEHAIVVVGFSWNVHPTSPPLPSPHVWSQVNSLLAIDDNSLPYINVATEPSGPIGDAPYTAQDFDAFIAPLPEKIFYPAEAVEKLSKNLSPLLRGSLGISDEDTLLRRYFITTISTLRNYAREHRSELGERLVGQFMHLDTAQFVWVVEYASKAQWAKGHITARAIVDASASRYDPSPIWLLHDGQLALVFDRSPADDPPGLVELNRPKNTPLGRMEKNLRPVRST